MLGAGTVDSLLVVAVDEERLVVFFLLAVELVRVQRLVGDDVVREQRPEVAQALLRVEQEGVGGGS